MSSASQGGHDRPKMRLTVAIIGGDGAGKTTVAKKLESSAPLPMKYLYMGVSTRSSDHALLTSRIVLLLKQWAYSRKMRQKGSVAIESIPARNMEYEPTERGPVWTALRYLNRFLEAWYRQIISLWFQARGYVMIYDRYVLFDSAPPVVDTRPAWHRRLDALNHWVLRNFYPAPRLTVFLDAPADLLFSRKGETGPEYLRRRREAYLKQADNTANFVRVDATRPVDEVYDEVQCVILDFYAKQNGRRPTGGGRMQHTGLARHG